MKLAIQTPRGMYDLLQEDADYFLGLQEVLLKLSNLYNFQYIRTPLVESEKVFTSSLGNLTDVVEKEMYYLKGPEAKEKFVLRPEGTAGVVRAYLQEGMHSWSQPVKLFYLGSMYRKEKPQALRLREHFQWGAEILGSKEPICDAQIIQLVDGLFKKFKLKDYVFKLNSIGCVEDRKKYKKVLLKYFKPYSRKICEDCKRRYKINPLRLLDCKNEVCVEIKQQAPTPLNHLCKECEAHFGKVLEYLDDIEVAYELDGTLVRGFDYYSKTVFEIFFTEKTIAIGGGGRYDYLAKMLGGQDLPAVGMAIGIERLTEILKMHQIKMQYFKKPQIFLAQVSEEARKEALKLFELLVKNGLLVSETLSKASLSSQLDLADKLKVRFTLIIGHKELGQKNIIFKDMLTGDQETIPMSQLIEELKRRL
jgi:histidyl-tRNA synthetase